jgi:hypothetical protein
LSTNLDVITPYSNDSPNSLRTRVIIGGLLNYLLYPMLMMHWNLI